MHSVKQWAVAAVLLAWIVAVACVDMSAPKGPASISLLQFPSLYVVRGDTMRDTNGVAMAPSVISYDAAGNVLSDETAQFFITDSLPAAHFANGKLFGDVIGTVHIIGQVGNVQTPTASIPVTVAPASISTSLTAATDTISVPVGVDSASSIGTLALSLTVRGADGVTPVPGVIVTYTLTPQASKSSSTPSAYLLDDSNNPSLVDTTDASGGASRRLTVNAQFLTGASSQVVTVTASAKYKGAALQGAPVTFSIPIKLNFSIR